MASDQDTTTKWKETLSLLEDVKQQESEINRLLDLIKERRNQSASRQSQSSSQRTDDEKSETLSSESKRNATKDDKRIKDTERSKQEVPKGILRNPKLGSKDSYGFIEQFDLNDDQICYGSQLRRRNVAMNQDNRLCLRFGFEPNLGCEYVSTETTETTETTGSTGSRSMPKGNIQTARVENAVKPPNMFTTSQPDQSGRKTAIERQVSHTIDNRRKTSPEQVKKPISSATGSGVNVPRSSVKPQTKPLPSGTGPATRRKVSQDHSPNTKPRKDRSKVVSSTDKTKPSEPTHATTSKSSIAGSVKQSAQASKTPQAQLQLLTGGMTIESITAASKDAYSTFLNQMLSPLGLDSDDPDIKAWVKNLFDPIAQGKFDLMTMTQQLQQIPQILIDKVSENGMTIDEETLDSEIMENAQKVFAQWMTSFQQQPGIESEVQDNDDNDDNDDDNDDVNEKESVVENPPDEPREPSPVESQTSDCEYDGEPVYIDITQWSHYAEKEREHGKYSREIREKGIDTIFCLDVSSSMKGAAWKQADEFIRNYIEGINSNLHDSVYEHIALVTFGCETRVQQHLTCDYLEITRKLDSLKPGGPSPLYAGLQMCQAAVLGAGEIFTLNGYRMFPRIFLITDGKATEAGLVMGLDKHAALSHIEEVLVLSEIKSLSNKLHIKVNPVPVGNYELPLLEKIATVSKGQVVSPDDWRLQAKSFRNYLAVAKVDRNSFGNSPEQFRLLLNLFVPDTPPDDMEQMVEFLQTQREANMSDDEERSELPHLGSRVRRTVPRRTGTVTKHFPDGYIGVTWDEALPDSSLREKCEYSSLTVVNEPRVLHDELIAIGCRVQRGSDWRYNEQDGGRGSHGTVIDVEQNGIVKVRWNNGGMFSYRFGAEGKFDIEIVQEERQTVREPDNILIQPLSKEDAERKRIQELNNRNKTESKPSSDSDSMEATGFSPSANLQFENERENSTRLKPSDKSKTTRRMTDGSLNIIDSSVRTDSKIKPSFSSDIPSTTVTERAHWMWQNGEHWVPYTTDVSEKIETSYIKHPTGTCVIQINDEQYRIAFSQMKQINVTTREKTGIKRNVETGK